VTSGPSSDFFQQGFMGKKVILASGSPRRKELLHLAGIRFEVATPDVNEDPIPDERPKKMVKRLAEEKALEVWRNRRNFRSPLLIIAADTTVVNPNGEILGKPRNRKEAILMVTSLQGKIHKVYTGYTILDVSRGQVDRNVSRVVETRVKIRKMKAEEVRAYVDCGESLDKAGGYAAQGFGMTLIERISGSYTNVVGLPITQVLEDLKDLGWKP